MSAAGGYTPKTLLQVTRSVLLLEPPFKNLGYTPDKITSEAKIEAIKGAGKGRGTDRLNCGWFGLLLVTAF